MQQTFPSGAAQRVVMPYIGGDLRVHGWEQQTIQVESDEEHVPFHQEDGALILESCSDSVKLWVPFETVVEAMKIEGDVEIEHIRRVTLEEVEGNAHLRDIQGDITLRKVHGDLEVAKTTTLSVRDGVGGDVTVEETAQVEIRSVGGDGELKNVQQARVGNIGGDLEVTDGIVSLRSGSIGSDCEIQGGGNAEVVLSHVGNSVTVGGVARVCIAHIGNDCEIRDSAHAEISLGNVGNELTVVGAASFKAGNVGNDCDLRDIQGNVRIGHIGGDANFLGIGGDLQTGFIGADAQIRGLRGTVDMSNIGSDLTLQADFLPETVARLRVGSDAHIIIPPRANVALRAKVGGDIKGHGHVSRYAGKRVNLIYGEGAALLELTVGGDLSLQSEEEPREEAVQDEYSYAGGSGKWMTDLGREMADLGMEMGRMGVDLTRDIWASIVETPPPDARSAASMSSRSSDYKQRFAEKQKRFAEKQQKRAGKHAKVDGQSYARDWYMDTDRLERIVEQAHRAAAEGIQGALEAVEQAFKNVGVTPTRAYSQSNTSVEGMAPAASASTSAEHTSAATEEAVSKAGSASQPASINIAQEREAILRMIAEGRITPEEGDMLLEALDS